MSNFSEIEEEDQKAPEALKEMLVSEIDAIRDIMVIVNMFVGEPLLAGLKYVQYFESKNNKVE